MSSELEKYKNLITKLLPIGRAWEKVKKHDLWLGIVGEFCRVEDRASDLLLTEMDVNKTVELLTDWETMVGIPDECTDTTGLTLPERRDAVLERMARVGSLSASFYEKLGLLLGFEITVEDANPFRAGISRVGDSLYNSERIRDIFRVEDNRVGDQLAVFGWRYYFIVTVPIAESSSFRVGVNRVGEPLREFGNQVVQCTLQQLKPSHTGIVYRFIE